MRMTVLGSGCCELTVERSSPAYAVRAGETLLMLDLGQGAWRRLAETGAAADQVRAVLLSHHHLDHCADLVPLLFALHCDPVMRGGRQTTLFADPAFASVLDGLEELFGTWVSPGPELWKRVWLHPGDGDSVGDVQILCARASHTDSSLAFRLEWRGRSLAYLGDSRPSAELTELAAGAELLVCHSAGTAGEDDPKHMHPLEAGQLARDAGVKGLLLSHFRRSQVPATAVAAAASVYPGPVWAAEDLMSFVLEPVGPRMLDRS